MVGLPALSHVKREDNPNPKLECFHVVHVVEDNDNVNDYDNFSYYQIMDYIFYVISNYAD